MLLLPQFILIIFMTASARAADVLMPPEIQSSTSTPAPTPPPSANPLESKHRMEDAVESHNPFGVVPHRPNYLLPYTYNKTPNQGPYQSEQNGGTAQKGEAKFQISFRLPLWKHVLSQNIALYAAYTQLSFWQAYNTKDSSPFRENNYEPEAFLEFNTHGNILGLENQSIVLGADHQSNGLGTGGTSRSWNRVQAEFLLNRGNFVLSLKPWWRIPEPSATDNNPDIEKYMGYGELRARYKLGSKVASLLWRNNFRSAGSNKGAVELGLSGPLIRQLRWYLQYFDGYGESLIDYNHADQRFGAGVLFGEWL
jgi:phospholipase A1